MSIIPWRQESTGNSSNYPGCRTKCETSRLYASFIVFDYLTSRESPERFPNLTEENTDIHWLTELMTFNISYDEWYKNAYVVFYIDDILRCKRLPIVCISYQLRTFKQPLTFSTVLQFFVQYRVKSGFAKYNFRFKVICFKMVRINSSFLIFFYYIIRQQISRCPSRWKYTIIVYINQIYK